MSIAAASKVRRTTAGSTVLSVQDLTVSFPSEAGAVRAVRGVSFDLAAGEVLGIVGESGSGKSVTSLAIMGLLPETATLTGSIKLHGDELIGKGDDDLSKLRGNELAMVFQDPLSSLTPIYTVGDQITEALEVHSNMSGSAARARAVELLDLVGIPNPKIRLKSFPHEFSGGMRQRVMIAMAIANDPDVIIADEPTTALDVTIQAQVLEVLRHGAARDRCRRDHDHPRPRRGRRHRRPGAGDVRRAGRRDRHRSTTSTTGRACRTRSGCSARCRGSTRSRSRRSPPSRATRRRCVNLPPGCPFAGALPDGRSTSAAWPSRRSPPTDGEGHRAACVRSGEVAAGNLTYADIYPLPPVHPNALDAVPRDDRPEVLRVEGHGEVSSR